MITVFESEYSGESICDIDRDVSEAFYEDFNKVIKQIPKDEHNIQLGTFKVTITWENDD